MNNSKALKKEILSYEKKAAISPKDFSFNWDFVADPFIFLHKSIFLLFVEVMKSNGEQFIGMFSSNNLEDWEYERKIIDSNKNPSFPYIFSNNKGKYIFPCYGTGKRNLTSLYKFDTPFGEYSKIPFDLKENRRINDRIVIRLDNDKVFALYGVSLISNRIGALTAKEISFDSKEKIKTKKQEKIVARRTVKEYLRSRLSSEPVLTYRPGGSVIKKGKNYVVIPVQATRDRSYGECLALAKINFEKFRIESKKFILPEEFSKNYEKIHHLSLCQDDKNVYAMDYQTKEESWQVGIYVNPK